MVGWARECVVLQSVSGCERAEARIVEVSLKNEGHGPLLMAFYSIEIILEMELYVKVQAL